MEFSPTKELNVPLTLVQTNPSRDLLKKKRSGITRCKARLPYRKSRKEDVC